MFLDSYKYKNWKKPEPSNLLEYFLSPALFNLRIINFFFQKIMRINSEVPFMVHFTSRVSKTIYIGRGVAEYFANSGGCYIQGINKVYIGDYTIYNPVFAGFEIHNLFEFFMVFVVLTGLAAIILFALTPILKKMMHGIR